MRVIFKRFATAVVLLLVIVCAAGCSRKQEKKPKPKPQATAVVDNGNIDAQGKGEGQSDKPLVIGCDKLSKKFNPFAAKSMDDKQAVDLTQLYLVSCDRQGQIIYKGIDGEVKTYNGNSYTYYGPADISVKYNKKKDETLYTILLRDDLRFSDGEPVTIDDVIFTMYVLCDKDYKGSYNLGNQNIKGLLRYQNNKKVKNISGIKRLGNYKMSIITDGFNVSMAEALKIPVCPLHYYGDVAKYNYSKKRFGFKKGDISGICANKTSPAGAGPYRFVKYEEKIAYYASNEIYYKGCPKIAYVQLKEMGGILKAAQSKIDRETAGSQGTAASGDGVTEENNGDGPVLNRNAEALEMTEGTVDVINTVLDGEDISWVAYANSNGEITGNKITTNFVPTGVYQYIGINAQNVKTGKEPGSRQSKNLRKAFAVAFSAFRDNLYDYYKDGLCIIQYPCSSASWLCAGKGDEDYKQAYNRGINGGAIYNEEDDAEKRYEDVKAAVLSYLEAAGYTINGMSVSSAPAGAALEYSIIVAGGETNPLYQLVSQAAGMFQDIGMELDIIPASGEEEVEKRITNGKLQMWAGRCNTNTGISLYKRYADKDSLFGITNKGFAKLAKLADRTVKDKFRKQRYKRCYNSILGMAVEVPVIEQQEALLYSSSRIDTDTMAKDLTAYYSWVNEIESVEMK